MRLLVITSRTTNMGVSTLCVVVLATLFVATHGEDAAENPGLATLDDIMKDIDLTKLKNMEAGPEKDARLKDLKEKMVKLKDDLEKIKDAKKEDQAKNDAKKEEPAPVENDAKKDEPAPVENDAKKEEPAPVENDAKKEEAEPAKDAKKEEPVKNDVQTGVPLERDAKKDLKERVSGLLHKFHDAYKKMDQPKKDMVKGKLVKLFSDVKTLVAHKKAAAVKDARKEKVAGLLKKFHDAYKKMDQPKKDMVKGKLVKLFSDVKTLVAHKKAAAVKDARKEKVVGLLKKFHDAYKKMDQPKKDMVKGKLVKLISDVKTLVGHNTAAAVKDQKLSAVAGVIHKFKDAFDHLDDEKKHKVAYKVRKLYSDAKRLAKLKRDSHRQNTLKSVKAHLKDFIAKKIEASSSTAEEKDAKHAKITALAKRIAQSLKDHKLPKSKHQVKDAIMNVVTEARDIIAPHHAVKKMDPLTSMLGHAKEFIGKMIEKTSSTQEEKDAKHAKVTEIMHGVAKSLKANDIPQTKDGLKESMKSIAHDLVQVMKKKE